MNATTVGFGCCQIEENRFASYYVSTLAPAPSVILCSSGERKVLINLSTPAPKIEVPASFKLCQCHAPRIYFFATKRVLDIAWSPKGFPWGDSFHEKHFSLEWQDLEQGTYVNNPEKLIKLEAGKYLQVTIRSNLQKRTDELFRAAFKEMNLRLVIFLEKANIEEATCFDVTGDKIQRFDLANHTLVPSSQEELDSCLKDA